jgi:hypothetical protein
VTVGTIGPIGSGLPQLGFPRRFAMDRVLPCSVLRINDLVLPAVLLIGFVGPDVGFNSGSDYVDQTANPHRRQNAQKDQ